jgi:hypothetical protein
LDQELHLLEGRRIVRADVRAVSRNPILAADRALLAVRSRLTPGQRWTAGLALGLATVVLLLGAPVRVVLVPGAAAAEPSVPGRTVVATPTPGPVASPVAPGGGPVVAPPVSNLPPAAQPSATPAPSAPPIDIDPGGLITVAPPTKVVALVRYGDGVLPGRDDATAAQTFLGALPTPTTLVDIDSADACAQAHAAGTVVLAVRDLPAGLRQCLLTVGLTVVAHDRLGSVASVQGAGGLVSTRRSELASLRDLARWGRSSGALRGRVGLLLDAARKPELAGVAAAYRKAGVQVVSTQWLGDSATNVSGRLAVVQAFTAARVAHVVLALPVAEQARFVTAARTGGFDYVVSDSADGVANESYPATFDGALAHTSLRVQWFARDHGPTQEQTDCETDWTSSVMPPVLLGGEQVDVFAWCAQVALLGRALLASELSAQPLDRTLRLGTFASPLTSDLATLPDGYGPVADAVLVWRRTCSCWTERTPFRRR